MPGSLALRLVQRLRNAKPTQCRRELTRSGRPVRGKRDRPQPAHPAARRAQATGSCRYCRTRGLSPLDLELQHADLTGLCAAITRAPAADDLPAEPAGIDRRRAVVALAWVSLRSSILPVEPATPSHILVDAVAHHSLIADGVGTHDREALWRIDLPSRALAGRRLAVPDDVQSVADLARRALGGGADSWRRRRSCDPDGASVAACRGCPAAAYVDPHDACCSRGGREFECRGDDSKQAERRREAMCIHWTSYVRSL
jgi:hypothetical protein